MRKLFANLILLAALLASLLLVGCNSAGDGEKNEEVNDGATLQIGMCFDSFLIERWERDRDVFVSTAKDLGAEVYVQNANGDVNEQIAQIEYLIKKKMDVIVIVAIDGDSLSDVVKKARNEGIVVIAYDRLIKNADLNLYISFDNEKVGEMMGQAIAENEDCSNVIMACGSKSDNNVSLVENGFINVMDENGINIMDRMYCDGWKAEMAYDYVDSNIDLIDSADAIMCGNDDIATNVIRALSVNRRAGKIVVVGQDADLTACQHIVEGTQKMTVYKPVERLASQAAKYAISYAKKEEPLIKNKINNGAYDVPYVALTPVSVDSYNMDSVIIDGGFHLREDVYLNTGK